MAIDRLIPNSTTPTEVPGNSFMDAVQEELTGLWDYASVPLTVTGGTANDIEGTLSPPLTDGWKDGMRVTFVAPDNNTNAMTVTVPDGGTVDLSDGDGGATPSGRVLAGHVYEAVYIAADAGLRLLGAAMPAGFQADYQAFASSGTWTKPANINANAMVRIRCWGGGGGGNAASGGGGGGGGSMAERIMRASELTATVAVTIAAGGATGGQGGNTTFGAYLTGYGGGGGSSGGPSNGGGGGGAGLGGPGQNAVAQSGGLSGGPIVISGGAGAGAGGPHGGAGGGGGSNGGGSHFGGGGGGGGGNTGAGSGGGSVFGGGGGAGGNAGGSAGTSLYGGAGGATGVAGTAPAGGGGRNAVGGGGRCEVYVIG